MLEQHINGFIEYCKVSGFRVKLSRLPSSDFRFPKSGLRVPGFGKMRTPEFRRIGKRRDFFDRITSEFRFPNSGIPENRKQD